MSVEKQSGFREISKKLMTGFSEDEQREICQAMQFALQCHEGQYRHTGEPYFWHPFNVALILKEELKFTEDAEMIEGALLHDVVEDSNVSVEDIRVLFGPSTSRLVEALTKIEPHKKGKSLVCQVASLRKLFMIGLDENRALVIKLADRLHNLRTLKGIEDLTRQRSFVQETLDIFYPLTHLMGFEKVHREMEEICLEYVEFNSHFIEDEGARGVHGRQQKILHSRDWRDCLTQWLALSGTPTELLDTLKYLLYECERGLRAVEHSVVVPQDIMAPTVGG